MRYRLISVLALLAVTACLSDHDQSPTGESERIESIHIQGRATVGSAKTPIQDLRVGFGYDVCYWPTGCTRRISWVGYTEVDGSFEVAIPWPRDWPTCEEFPIDLVVEPRTVVSEVRCTPGLQNLSFTLDEECDPTDPPMSVSPPAIQLGVGWTHDFEALMNDCGELVRVSAAWDSSDDDVARVSGGGRSAPTRVTGSAAGSATLTATFGRRTASSTVTVKAAPADPRGPFAYVAGDRGGIAVIDLATLSVLRDPIDASASDMAVAPDGSRVYLTRAGTEDVAIIDVETNTLSPDPIPLGSRPRRIAITPDGEVAYVVLDESSEIAKIDLRTNSLRESIPVAADPSHIAVAPSGRRAYITHPVGDRVTIHDLTTDTAASELLLPGARPSAVEVSPDGTRAYVALTFGHAVAEIDTDTNTVVEPHIPVGRFPSDISITPDGRFAYVSSTETSDVSVIDLSTRSVIARVPAENPWALAVAPDGNRVLVANIGGNSVSIIDVASQGPADEPPIAVGSFPDVIVIAARGAPAPRPGS